MDSKNKHITLYLNVLFRHDIFTGCLNMSLIAFKPHSSIVFLRATVELDNFVSMWKQMGPAESVVLESQNRTLDKLGLKVLSALNSKNRLQVLSV